MESSEARTIEALALMVRQHCPTEEEGKVSDSIAMSSNEAALLILADYGYVELLDTTLIMCRWTEAGKALLAQAAGVSVEAALAVGPVTSRKWVDLP